MKRKNAKKSKKTKEEGRRKKEEGKTLLMVVDVFPTFTQMIPTDMILHYQDLRIGNEFWSFEIASLSLAMTEIR